MAEPNNPQALPATSNPLPLPSTNDHPAPSRAAQAAPAPKPKTVPVYPPDSSREALECIVFVVVLVLLLKSFVAEAFVIPTGSMATTLLGYQKDVTCPKCGFTFPVNCSAEVEETPPKTVVGAVCPNCREQIDFQRDHMNPSCSSGDRVLVAKYLYDTGIIGPHRFDVVVFKYPENPQADYVPMNYIKRLIGLPGETIGIYHGKLYVLPPGQGPQYPEDNAADPLDRWRHRGLTDFMHQGDADALLLKENTPFQILRKPPDKILALRRIVYDNDHPATDLNVPRWKSDHGEAWAADEKHGFHHAAGQGDGLDWLRYRNILRGWDKPELITDFLGYNSKASAFAGWQNDLRYPYQGGNWVGDLILECAVTVDKPEGDLVLELSKGVDRFRAAWKLASGACTLTRLHDGKEEILGDKDQPTNLKKPGTYKVRFANVDERLVVWVDRSLPFGDGVDYPAPPERAPTANDLQPASIGTRGGAVQVHQLTLWRDTYYTYQPKDSNPTWADSPEVRQLENTEKGLHELLSDPGRFQDAFGNLPASTYYVQPGHYLCLGDNSPESSDGRSWGLVPQRLLLGRALLVYYPLWGHRAGPIK